jgi:hypothetical protein
MLTSGWHCDEDRLARSFTHLIGEVLKYIIVVFTQLETGSVAQLPPDGHQRPYPRNVYSLLQLASQLAARMGEFIGSLDDLVERNKYKPFLT